MNKRRQLLPRPLPFRRTRQRIWPVLRDYLVITIGVIIVATTVDLFLVANSVVTGGASGVAIILNKQFGISIGLVVLLINLPLFAFGLRYLGGFSFGARTVYAVVLLSLIIDQIPALIHQFPALEANLTVKEPLLYILYGGIGNGLGTGLVFRARGTTGGSDIGARLLDRFTPLSLGNAFIALDAGLFIVAGFFFGLEKILYAMTVSFISSRMVDFIQQGFNYSRLAIIITSQEQAVAQLIMNRTGHGVTILPGKGAYTMQERPVLLAVVLPSEVSILTAIIREVDPTAFVIISEANEVLGEGFRPLPAPPPPPAPLPIPKRRRDNLPLAKFAGGSAVMVS